MWRRLALGVAMVAAVASAPRVLRRTGFFRVRQVEVVGGRFLTGAEIARALDLSPEASLFDRLGGLVKRVLEVPGVRSAEIGRRWPGTVVVRIVEAEPVALTANEGRLALMDEAAAVLPFDPTRAPPDLPVAQRDRAVARVLAKVRETEPALFGAVQAARRAGEDVVLELQGTAGAAGAWGAAPVRMLLRAGATVAAIRGLAAVARDLARRGRRYEELDARFIDRVFVRGMRS